MSLDPRLHRSCISRGGFNVVSVLGCFCLVHIPRSCKSLMGISVLGTDGFDGSELSGNVKDK